MQMNIRFARRHLSVDTYPSALCSPRRGGGACRLCRLTYGSWSFAAALLRGRSLRYGVNAGVCFTRSSPAIFSSPDGVFLGACHIMLSSLPSLGWSINFSEFYISRGSFPNNFPVLFAISENFPIAVCGAGYG